MSKNEISKKVTSNILTHVITTLDEGMTGILASKREELILSVGHVFQRLIRRGEFLSAIKREWDRYREKGRIRDDYEQTEQHKACLQELLDALDKDLPDETRFSVLKQIFLVAATEQIYDRNSHLPLQFMQIARRLSTGEILILNAAYRIVQGDDRSWEQNRLAAPWLERVARESGLQYPELVEVHEKELIKKGLITDRTGARAGEMIKVTPGKHFRLTELGYALCEYIEHYERQSQNADS